MTMEMRLYSRYWAYFPMCTAGEVICYQTSYWGWSVHVVVVRVQWQWSWKQTFAKLEVLQSQRRNLVGTLEQETNLCKV